MMVVSWFRYCSSRYVCGVSMAEWKIDGYIMVCVAGTSDTSWYVFWCKCFDTGLSGASVLVPKIDTYDYQVGCCVCVTCLGTQVN